MTNNIKNNIVLLKKQGVDLLDITATKNKALDKKMYDLIVYINNHPLDYLHFIETINKKTP